MTPAPGHFLTRRLALLIGAAARFTMMGLHVAGTLIAFRLGAYDADMIAREFEPVFTHRDLLNLPNHHIYLKLMIDGAPSRPFSATTLPPHSLRLNSTE